ncbi:DNA polymerase III subunit gamma/tau [Dongia sedimenti]|uniref:DNA polymerase III subunit gamma/tau n=1 Tax=Dongia sedimenti TaxID=3064282 RepID=A0ABU0YP31_9PROT|nr:DNA polymerase III subunit gamma/tau [Rhodospirillaceae bacterium R-7]
MPNDNASGDSVAAVSAPYRVLARKYRPSDFAGLIGQEALVRTLTNAIAQGRLAHAFMLTGVRGVGKTTTARILARAFNCIGPDGKGGPTASPCGQCEHCTAIAEDRHVDVIEMDAASRTGVNDIRELIEGVRYRPVSARFKIYIIDEVHMLSSSAFNALLKTLEEPPEHVKFIFATTEIRKVPVTVLSRCQRFDLRRIEADKLAQHLGSIAASEGAKLAPNALALIARAADGSARDGLSLLDQAITLVDQSKGEAEVTEEQVRAMLGIADRTQLFELYEAVMAGRAAEALGQLRRMYEAGADPIVVLQDLLDLTHWLTRCKLTPDVLQQPAVPEAERKRGGALAKELSLPILARAWQMLLKGLAEAQYAPQPLAAAEMALIRLMHVADLPTPGDLVKQLSSQAVAPAQASPSQAPRGGSGNGNGPSNIGGPVTSAISTQQIARDPAAAPAPVQAAMPPLRLDSFDAIVELFKAKKEGILLTHIMNDVHLVRFEPGRIELRPTEKAPANLTNRMTACLNEWTGTRWFISVSGDLGAPTLKQQAQAHEAEMRRRAAEHPLVKAVLDAFPGATIDSVRDLTTPEPTTEAADDEAAPLPEESGPEEDA